MELKSNNRILLFPKLNKLIFIIILIALIIAGLRGYQLFSYIFRGNVSHDGTILIPGKASFQQVLDSLEKQKLLENKKAFIWVSKKKNYPASIKPGHYSLSKGMATNNLVNMLKAGNQSTVEVTFNQLRFMPELAGKVAHYLQPDSVELLNYLTDSAVIRKAGFNRYSFHALFIPNTYRFYWTTTPAEFLSRMEKEYKNFWNAERRTQAKAIGLTPEEVITLASIVQEETIQSDEKPVVAGLYLNRLKRGMLLQADPTIRYAIGDFSVHRILNKYLTTNSPFNTYKYKGLPPGPINFPERSSIEAVLHADHNNYYYMCAKDDFSGYHNFARTLSQHNINAEKYRRALNHKKIWH